MPENISYDPKDTTEDSAARAIEALLSRPGGTADPKDPDASAAPATAAPQTPAEPTPAVVAAPEAAAAEPKIETSVTPPEPKPEPPEIKEYRAKAREADTAKLEANTARDQLLNQLNSLIPQFQASLRGEFADVKTEDDQLKLMETDPDRYNRYVIAQTKLQRAVASQQTLAAQRFQEWQKTEKTKLNELLPDLADPEKGPKLTQDILSFAKKNGYSDQQITMASASDITLIHKAMLWERGEAQRQTDAKTQQAALEAAKAKAAGAPPVQRPGTQRPDASKQEKVDEDFKRLQRTGTVNDAAAVFRHILNG